MRTGGRRGRNVRAVRRNRTCATRKSMRFLRIAHTSVQRFVRPALGIGSAVVDGRAGIRAARLRRRKTLGNKAFSFTPRIAGGSAPHAPDATRGIGARVQRRCRADRRRKKSPKLLTHKKTVIRFRPSSDTCESEWRNQTRQRAPQNGPPPGQPNRWTQGSFPSRKHPTHSRAARSAAGGPGFFASAHRVHRRQELSISAGARACRRRFRCIGSRVHRPVAGLFPRRCLELGNTPIDH